MTQPSTISVESLTPRIRKITFSNPPVNLLIPEAFARLQEVIAEMSADPEVRVAIFTSSTPDYFINHFDLAAAGDVAEPPAEGEVPPAVDVLMGLTKAPFISIAAIRGRTRGGGNELALAFDLRYASREQAVFGQPEVASGLLPGGGGSERLPRLIGRDRAMEAILGSDDYDADLAERYGWITRALPDAELDSFVESMAARLASFDKATLSAAKAQINRATLPPDADLYAAYGEFLNSMTSPGFQERLPGVGKLISELGVEEWQRNLGKYLGLANQQA